MVNGGPILCYFCSLSKTQLRKIRKARRGWNMSSYLVIFHNTHFLCTCVLWLRLLCGRVDSDCYPFQNGDGLWGLFSPDRRMHCRFFEVFRWIGKWQAAGLGVSCSWVCSTLENALISKEVETTKKISAANFQLHQIIESRIRIRIRIRSRAPVSLSPVCTCTPPHSAVPLLRQRISPIFQLHIAFLWRLRFVRLLPTFNYFQSFHILNLLACCLCSDFSAALFLFLQKFLCFSCCCSWVLVANVTVELGCKRTSKIFQYFNILRSIEIVGKTSVLNWIEA